MTIPKIDLSKSNEILDQLNSKEELDAIFKLFTEEQGSDQELILLMIGLVNLEAAKGFLICYILMRNALIEEEMKSFK